jgi:hypothetical protein
MSKADHSDTTRRTFLASAAVAGVAVVAAPAEALATGAPDPTFALIEARRAAEQAYAAACSEQSRREGILIDEGTGLCPFAVMVDGGKPIVVYTHQQIEAYGESLSEQVKARARTALDAAVARYETVFGNIENEAGELGDASTEAFDNLIGNTPTSIGGLKAMLSYLLDEVDDLNREFYGEEPFRVLLCSIENAINDIVVTS